MESTKIPIFFPMSVSISLRSGVGRVVPVKIVACFVNSLTEKTALPNVLSNLLGAGHFENSIYTSEGEGMEMKCMKFISFNYECTELINERSLPLYTVNRKKAEKIQD